MPAPGWCKVPRSARPISRVQARVCDASRRAYPLGADSRCFRRTVCYSGDLHPQLDVIAQHPDDDDYRLAWADGVGGERGDVSGVDEPAVFRNPRTDANARVTAMAQKGVERLDIPAFLRRQAD